MRVAAWIAIGLAGAVIFYGPFLIGKPREPLEASGYIVELFSALVSLMVAGRVLGWW